MTDSLVDVIAAALTDCGKHHIAKKVVAAIEASGKVVIDKACEVKPERIGFADVWPEMGASAGTTKVYAVNNEEAGRDDG